MVIVARLKFALIGVQVVQPGAEPGRSVRMLGEGGKQGFFESADTKQSPTEGGETVDTVALHLGFRPELGIVIGADLFKDGALAGPHVIEKSGFAAI